MSLVCSQLYWDGCLHLHLILAYSAMVLVSLAPCYDEIMYVRALVFAVRVYVFVRLFVPVCLLQRI